MRIRRRITWQYLLDAHGPKIGAACCAMNTVITAGMMIWMFVYVAAEVIKP